ncbi:MAG: leucine-rich repeat domain-containing protein [Microcystis wesenbergii Mw_MB_S_20031200_S109]|uniref:Leucine-rich repeat domain-containing protein n=1 Tax=Microcystis wesenbergii Mw_MB_S_20031200_S109D TaxID=2486241 RepID=A0A552LWX6_9CHRO|nr:MAG: leucine-rich repeat domain-containing protein [Microcystis wesenbergii Mw_MB_S_20031200_S109]TRV24698.1 MAG: leucine-rich repeat domain-containing protein [Microcystis wesenbergii Mw_MB_S_20031200_S109D]
MTAQEVLELIQRAKDERAWELDLSNKNLTEIPPEIAQLTSLPRLDLGHNQIREIPEALAQLTSLQGLYLNNNQIRKIPGALAQLTSLRFLLLSNNPGDLRRNNIPARQSLCRRIRQAINGTLSKRKSPARNQQR